MEGNSQFTGKFAWEEIAGSAVPFIIRSNGEMFAEFRMLKKTLYKKHLEALNNNVFNIICPLGTNQLPKKYPVTPQERQLLSEINSVHCDNFFSKYARLPCSFLLSKEDALRVYDVMNIFYELVTENKIGNPKSGYILIDGSKTPVPFVDVEGIGMVVPLFFFECPAVVKIKLELTDHWSLVYLKLLCKLLAILENFYDQDTLMVVKLDLLKEVIPEVRKFTFVTTLPTNAKIRELVKSNYTIKTPDPDEPIEPSISNVPTIIKEESINIPSDSEETEETITIKIETDDEPAPKPKKLKFDRRVQKTRTDKPKLKFIEVYGPQCGKIKKSAVSKKHLPKKSQKELATSTNASTGSVSSNKHRNDNSNSSSDIDNGTKDQFIKIAPNTKKSIKQLRKPIPTTATMTPSSLATNSASMSSVTTANPTTETTKILSSIPTPTYTMLPNGGGFFIQNPAMISGNLLQSNTTTSTQNVVNPLMLSQQQIGMSSAFSGMTIPNMPHMFVPSDIKQEPAGQESMQQSPFVMGLNNSVVFLQQPDQANVFQQPPTSIVSPTSTLQQPVINTVPQTLTYMPQLGGLVMQPVVESTSQSQATLPITTPVPVPENESNTFQPTTATLQPSTPNSLNQTLTYVPQLGGFMMQPFAGLSTQPQGTLPVVNITMPPSEEERKLKEHQDALLNCFRKTGNDIDVVLDKIRKKLFISLKKRWQEHLYPVTVTPELTNHEGPVSYTVETLTYTVLKFFCICQNPSEKKPLLINSFEVKKHLFPKVSLTAFLNTALDLKLEIFVLNKAQKMILTRKYENAKIHNLSDHLYFRLDRFSDKRTLMSSFFKMSAR